MTTKKLDDTTALDLIAELLAIEDPEAFGAIIRTVENTGRTIPDYSDEDTHCPVCGEEYSNTASQLLPKWSDIHDNTVCTTCKEQAEREQQ